MQSEGENLCSPQSFTLIKTAISAAEVEAGQRYYIVIDNLRVKQIWLNLKKTNKPFKSVWY